MEQVLVMDFLVSRNCIRKEWNCWYLPWVCPSFVAYSWHYDEHVFCGSSGELWETEWLRCLGTRKFKKVNTNLLCRYLAISLISHHFPPFSLCLSPNISYKNGSVGLATFHGFAWILLTDKCGLCFGLAQCQSNSDFQCQTAAQGYFEWQTKCV